MSQTHKQLRDYCEVSYCIIASKVSFLSFIDYNLLAGINPAHENIFFSTQILNFFWHT